MCSLSIAGQKPLEYLLHTIDSYASLITNDFVAGGRLITREFIYEGEKTVINERTVYAGQTCRLILPDGGTRFSIEVTEIFRSYLPTDENSTMRWTFHFNTRPEIRHLAISEAYKRIYPPAGILPVLSPGKPVTAEMKGSTAPLQVAHLSLPQTPRLPSERGVKPPAGTSAAPHLPQLNRPSSSSKAGHFNFPQASIGKT
ncbi:MAG: hypothetical protein NTX49_03060 [Chlamydiae bacterium]|nr:hypothetical protein [Chlamydiota bacterium]